MKTDLKKAKDPQELERLLISFQWKGDTDAMLKLYEVQAIIDDGSGQLKIGKAAIRELFEKLNASGEKFSKGEQSPAVVNGSLALT